MSRWKEIKEQKLAQAVTDDAPAEQDADYPPLEALEEDLENTLDDLSKGFRDRANQEKQRYAETCDSLYYFTVYFSNRQQMQEFCENFDMDFTQFFFDGRDIARKFKRALKTPDTTFKRTQPFNKDYLEHVRDV